MHFESFNRFFTQGKSMAHQPVMLSEVLESLSPSAGEVYVDGTFGAGGYTRAILDAADCQVVAIDRDDGAVARAENLKAEYGDRLIFIQGRFGDVETLLQSAGIEKVDGFVLDLGVSSMQLDEVGRGFSFRADAPLDMRMGQSESIATAADLVNEADEKDLADLIYKYGEERHSRRAAKKIVEARADTPIETTGQLAGLVRDAVPKSPKDKSDQATRTFQALRIAVNDELGELERALEAADKILNPDGRLVVVTFHSLEDRIVKLALQEKSGGGGQGSRHQPQIETPDPLYTLPFKKALKPSEEEIARNSRSRSAKLRAAIRLEAA